MKTAFAEVTAEVADLVARPGKCLYQIVHQD